MRGEIKRAVYAYLDSLKVARKIGGWEITKAVQRRCNEKVYPTVVLKIAKYWACLSCGAFDCIDRDKSIYQFHPGRYKVAGTQGEIFPVLSRVKEYKAERERGF